MPNDLYSLFSQYQNQQYNEPTEGVVTAVDGQFIDVYIRANASKLRNVFCASDTDNMYVGQTVSLVWTNHVPTASARTGGVSAGSSFTADGSSLEGIGGVIRVRRSGIQPWHLSFKPSMEGHTHLDSLQKSGWKVDANGVIQKDDVFIHPDGQISLGQSPDLMKLDASHATHRFWIGNVDPAQANFAVSKEGAMTAKTGSIAGWDILPNRFAKNDIEINSDGEITVGEGGDVAKLSSIDPDGWRFWIGSATPANAPFRVNKFGKAWISGAVVSGDMQSSNFTPGFYGWHIDNEGWAEFNDVTVRGTIKSSIFARSTTSVVAGRQIVAEGAVLISDVGIDDATIDLDGAAFVKNELVRLVVDGRAEWMRITGSPVAIDDGFRYTVERGLNGEANIFYAGETVFSGGAASQPEEPSTFGEFDRGWGAAPFGSGPYTAAGGFLTLDGSREYGPYFGAAIRYGADYRQVRDMLRMGKLDTFLDGMFPSDFGLAVGDASRYFAYTFRTGLSIKTDAGKTSIDDRGILSERFGLSHTDTPPDYLSGYTRFYVDPTTKALRVRSAFGAEEYDVAIADLESGGAGGAGVTDHGLMTGLEDDDHPQYHNNARGDARYSLLGHNHDAAYSNIGHNHDASYAPLSHSHAENLLKSGLSDWDEQASTPALPAANKHKVYIKNDGKIYTLDDAGVEAQVGSGSISDADTLDGLHASAFALAVHTHNYIAPVSANRPGVTRLYRRDDDSAYNLQISWDGTRWVLAGYSGDAYHAPARVAAADLLTGNEVDWASYRTRSVANMLGWKAYGNSHVIIDASASTSPTGSAINSTDAQYPWVATYPTLVGWNGSQTYGVRVDSARVADSLPRMTIYYSAAQGVPTGAWTTLAFDVEINDAWGWHNPAQNWLITPPAGEYQVILQNFAFTSNATGLRGLRVMDTAGNTWAMNMVPALNGDVTPVVLTAQRSIAAGTSIYVQAYQTCGGWLNLGAFHKVSVVRVG